MCFVGQLREYHVNMDTEQANEKNNSRWQTNIYTNFSIETASRSRNAMSFLLRVRVQYVCVFLCEVYNRIDATTTRWNASL